MTCETLDIFNLQKECVRNIFNLHQKKDDYEMEPCWKILIYDKKGQDIISPLFSVSELRENDITLSIQLQSERDEVKECVAIYFMEPSRENIEKFCDDLERKLYPKYFVAFIRPISRIDLEFIAQRAYNYNLRDRILKIYDEFLDYVSLQSDLFVSFSQPSRAFSFENINSKTISSIEIDNYINETVNSLYSTFLTIGIVPIIKFNRGGCAESVAKEFNRKIKDYLIETKGSNFQKFAQSRPLFLIIDRDIDLIPNLIHSWSYIPLIDDLYNIEINRIIFTENNNCEFIDFNFCKDKFLNDNKFRPFHEVAGNIKIEIESFKVSDKDLKNFNVDPDSHLNEDLCADATNKVSSAINLLPEKIMRKKFIDLHTKIATKIMDTVQNNQIDKIIEIEMRIINKSQKDTSEIYELISEVNIGLNHKIRLILLSFLCDLFSKNDIPKICKLLGCDRIPSLDYILDYKNLNSLNSSSKKVQSNYENVFSKIVARSPNILQGMKSLMLGDKGFNLTQIISGLIDSGSTDLIDLDTLDPKENYVGKSLNFNDIVVYVVGGGCYTEYQDVVSLINKKNLYGKSIIYGCTEMMNADYFVKQLNNLSNN